LRGEWQEIYAGLRDLISWYERKLRWSASRNKLDPRNTPAFKTIDDTITLLSTVGDAFDPKPYSGRIHLIRSEEQGAELKNDMTYGWQNVARNGVEVRTLPGDHYSLLEKPYVTKVAETVEDWLAK
jgi:thioesterase domain-containing protein